MKIKKGKTRKEKERERERKRRKDGVKVKEVGGEGAVAPREPGVKRGKLLNHTWITNQPFHAK